MVVKILWEIRTQWIENLWKSILIDLCCCGCCVLMNYYYLELFMPTQWHNLASLSWPAGRFSFADLSASCWPACWNLSMRRKNNRTRNVWRIFSFWSSPWGQVCRKKLKTCSTAVIIGGFMEISSRGRFAKVSRNEGLALGLVKQG